MCACAAKRFQQTKVGRPTCRFGILAPVPPMEIYATQPSLVSQTGGVTEIARTFGGADHLRNAMLYRQTTLSDHLRRTRDLLLPRLLSGQVTVDSNEGAVIK